LLSVSRGLDLPPPFSLSCIIHNSRLHNPLLVNLPSSLLTYSLHNSGSQCVTPGPRQLGRSSLYFRYKTSMWKSDFRYHLHVSNFSHSKTSLIRTNWERTLVQISESPNYRSVTENMLREVISIMDFTCLFRQYNFTLKLRL
jgi:hypothetical protein